VKQSLRQCRINGFLLRIKAKDKDKNKGQIILVLVYPYPWLLSLSLNYPYPWLLSFILKDKRIRIRITKFLDFLPRIKKDILKDILAHL